MNIKELNKHLTELETLPPHEELLKLREVCSLLTEWCVAEADLKYPGVAKALDRCVRREEKLKNHELVASA